MVQVLAFTTNFLDEWNLYMSGMCLKNENCKLQWDKLETAIKKIKIKNWKYKLKKYSLSRQKIIIVLNRRINFCNKY